MRLSRTRQGRENGSCETERTSWCGDSGEIAPTTGQSAPGVYIKREQVPKPWEDGAGSNKTCIRSLLFGRAKRETA